MRRKRLKQIAAAVAVIGGAVILGAVGSCDLGATIGETIPKLIAGAVVIAAAVGLYNLSNI